MGSVLYRNIRFPQPPGRGRGGSGLAGGWVGCRLTPSGVGSCGRGHQFPSPGDWGEAWWGLPPLFGLKPIHLPVEQLPPPALQHPGGPTLSSHGSGYTGGMGKGGLGSPHLHGLIPLGPSTNPPQYPEGPISCHPSRPSCGYTGGLGKGGISSLPRAHSSPQCWVPSSTSDRATPPWGPLGVRAGHSVCVSPVLSSLFLSSATRLIPAPLTPFGVNSPTLGVSSARTPLPPPP